MVISSFSVVFAAKGDSAEDPILIGTAQELVAVAQEINRSGNGGAGKFYKLTENIDLGGEAWYDSIGSKEVPFAGTFDGNEKIISNFKIPTNSKYSYIGIGLFGTIGGDAVVKNLGLEKVTAYGDDTWGWNVYAGALAGEVVGNAEIDRCFVRNVTFDTLPVHVGVGGGLVGNVNGEGVKITNSYVSGFSEIGDCCATEGGLAGSLVSFAEVANCYSTSNLATYPAADPAVLVTNSYCLDNKWYANVGRAAGTQLTEVQLKAKYEDLGEAYQEGFGAYGGYPALAWEVAPEGITGTGTEDDPYVIKTAAHLVEISTAAETDGVYYELGNDIDMEYATFSNYIGSSANPFMGEFDGKGHIIKNYKLVIPKSDTFDNWSYAAGIFGYVSGDAVIKNLGVENIEVSSAANSWRECAGAIVGIADGNATISGCYAKNITNLDTTGADMMALGGIAAATVSDGVVVENCYSIAADFQTGVDYDAGIVGAGNKFASIENCYSTKTISRVADDSYHANVVNCYYTGTAPWPSEKYVGTLVTTTELKGMAETLGAAFTQGSFVTGGMPALVWQPAPESSGGTGAKDDPMLVKTAQDLVNIAALENTSGMYFSLENDIDLEGTEWTAVIGSNEVPFKGYFDGNGHVISNYKLVATGNNIYGLFGVVGGEAYIYDLGVKDVKAVLNNAASWDSTCGGMIGLIQDNASLTGCYAKNVDFSLTFNRTWEGEFKWGGGLIGRINGGGVEIRNCYSKGFTQTYDNNGTYMPPVNNDGGFAGEGSYYATVANCYSDTTMFRAPGWLTNENCYQAKRATEWPGGYEWDADVVEDISGISYKLGKDFIGVEGEGPMLRWELGDNMYINLVEGGSFTNADLADFGEGLTLKSGKSIQPEDQINGRISKVVLVPANGVVSTTVETEVGAYYRVNIRTSAVTGEGTFDMIVGGEDFAAYLKDNQFDTTWESQTTIVKAAEEELTLTFAPSVDTYIDDIEIFKVDVDTEEKIIKESIRLNWQKNPYVDDKVAVDFLVNDGMYMNYASENGYIDSEGYLTELVPTGFGTFEEDYKGTIVYADREVSDIVTVTLKEREPYDIKKVELLNAEGERVYGMAKAEKIGNAVIDINTDEEAKIITSLYKDGKLTAIKTAEIAEDGVCEIDMLVGDNDTYKMFVVVENSVMPLAIPEQSYKTLKETDTVQILTIGDSLAATYDPAVSTLVGWGQVLGNKFESNVVVDNTLSLGGMTAQNFLFNGRFDTLLERMNPGDYVFIQLCTNDRVQKFTKDEFKIFLTQFVQMVRDNGGYPVFVTSPEESECATNEIGPDGKYVIKPVHDGWPDVMKVISAERDVPVIDLNAETQRFMAELGSDAILALNYWTSDTIHFTEAGANYLADFIADEAARIGLPIGEFLAK